MFVYFIRDPASDAIKIGTSANPKGRLAQLQTASAKQLELLGSVPGHHALERQCHIVLERWRLTGEWFSRSLEVRSFIATALRYGITLAMHEIAGANLEHEAAQKRKREADMRLRTKAGATVSPGDCERALRRSGVSRAMAKAVVSVGWKKAMEVSNASN